MLARFLSVLLLIVLAGSARADDAERLADPLRLEDAIALARQHRAEIAAARARAQAARERPAIVAALEDPMVLPSIDHLPFMGATVDASFVTSPVIAVRDGRSIETTMGLTPTGGLVMGTRSGDLDPGLLIYLLDHGYDARGLERLVEHEAGLLALSGTTSDMHRLLGSTDPRAALAIDVFCYQARRSIGALAAALEGLDQLVFTGGIGEHAPAIRWEICRGLAHLGVALDEDRNAAGSPLISTGTCEVRVVATDEERVIARHTRRLLAEHHLAFGP